MLLIFRPKNLFLIALLQCLILFQAGDYNYLFFNIYKTLYLLLSTLLIAAAGYIINDYFDVKIDLINKPAKVIIGNKIPRRWAIIIHVTLTSIGLGCAWLVNLPTFIISIVCALLLYLYSAAFKKQFLIGNLVIALLSALSVWICKAYINELYTVKILAYAAFAALCTFIREVIKDLEDEKGDAVFQSNTLAINLGLRKTKKIILTSAIILLIGIICYPLLAPELVSMPDMLQFAYPLFLWLGAGIPLITFIIKLIKSDKQKDFAQLSRLMKLIMLIGIFSIVLC